MALSIVCPGCEADYAVPENLIGKSIRCKKCGETIAVKAAKPKAKARVTADDEDDDTPRRPARRNRDEDDDDDDAPAKKKSKGLSPVLIGGLAALILGGGAAAYFTFAGDKEKDSVAGTPVKPVVTPVDPTPEEKKTDAGAGKTVSTTPKDESKKADVVPDKPAPKSAKTDPPKKEEPKHGMMASAGVASQPGGYEEGLTPERYRTGDMPKPVVERVKKAAVFIRTDFEGGAATGSGWFGIEPGIVFTNAHVLNMKAPHAQPPKKLTFWLNSGTPEQRMIPNANIKILAVDREIDIACLQIINEKDLPLPLKVRLSSDCDEGLGLTTIGFPLGYDAGTAFTLSGKEPEVSVRRTHISSMRHTEYGMLRRVQIEGGVTHGNSGGAVVDAEGHVCCVAVEVMTESEAVAGCVPTEFCFALLAGRVSDVEYGLPYRQDGKVRIPLTASVIDPFNRLKKVGIQAWVGNNSKKYRYPGTDPAKELPGDVSKINVVLKVDEKTKMAKGELELPELADNTVYWGQPYFENSIYPTGYYMAGQVIDTHGPPADRVPALLVYNRN